MYRAPLKGGRETEREREAALERRRAAVGCCVRLATGFAQHTGPVTEREMEGEIER